MYATLLRAKAWKQDVLDLYPEAEFNIVCALGHTELQQYCSERMVVNQNLFRYLLKLPLKEIETFIEHTPMNKAAREDIIPQIEKEFRKSTAIPVFLKTLIEAKEKVEKKLLESSKSSLKNEKEKEESKAVSLFIYSCRPRSDWASNFQMGVIAMQGQAKIRIAAAAAARMRIWKSKSKLLRRRISR